MNAHSFSSAATSSLPLVLAIAAHARLTLERAFRVANCDVRCRRRQVDRRERIRRQRLEEAQQPVEIRSTTPALPVLADRERLVRERDVPAARHDRDARETRL